MDGDRFAGTLVSSGLSRQARECEIHRMGKKLACCKHLLGIMLLAALLAAASNACQVQPIDIPGLQNSSCMVVQVQSFFSGSRFMTS